jgi:hypothetical protein
MTLTPDPGTKTKVPTFNALQWKADIKKAKERLLDAEASAGLDCGHAFVPGLPSTCDTAKCKYIDPVSSVEPKEGPCNIATLGTTGVPGMRTQGARGSHRTPWHPAADPLNPRQIGNVP